MFSIDLNHLCLIELIKASLFGSSPVIPKDINWEKIYDAAKMQCIVPLISQSVPTNQRKEWNEILYQSKAHLMRMIYEQNVLVQLFRDNNITFAILKGTAAAIYYPNPTLRTFGDIDIYVSKDHFDFAVNLLFEHGYEFLEKTAREFEFKKNGISFELHSKFSSKHYNDIEYIFLNGLNNAVEYNLNNNVFPAFPVYENGLVLLGHIMQHLKSSGIGLRQIIDWMMFVHKELDDFAWKNSFRALAVEAGLEKLAITVTFMCIKWLGLPDVISWCNDADEEVAEQLLVRILDDGNFGQDRAPYENIRIGIKNEGLFKHLQHTGIYNWRFAQKYSMLRPFAWLYQICRYACLGVARLFTGKKIFRKNKHNSKLEELWRELE